MTTSINKISELLNKLPGIGRRQAMRLSLAFLEWRNDDLKELAQSIAEIKNTYRLCEDCFNITENIKCKICTAPNREGSRIAVVEKISDLESIEKTGQYKGLYHVLGGTLNPAQGITHENLRISELSSRIKKLQSSFSDIEVILATNPNTHGETTALYVSQELLPLNAKITRLARGLSSGTLLEYADQISLINALKHRK